MVLSTKGELSRKKDSKFKERVINQMKKQAIFSMRLNRDMKRVLEVLARSEKRSLSSMVENILADYLIEKGIEWEQDERRSYPRKVIEMPARFTVRGSKGSEDHEVFLRDISQAGAYAVYKEIDGIGKILKKGVSVKAKLSIRVPNNKEPLTLNCEVVRISMDRNTTGIGLEYRKVRPEQQNLINEALVATG
jgi:hypothetical protein